MTITHRTLVLFAAAGLATCATYGQAVDPSLPASPNATPGASFYDPTGLTYAATPARWELALGGNGIVNKEFDASAGGVSVSIGQYVNPTLLASIRQSVNYVDNEGDNSAWNGSTRVAVDHHFGLERLRPFVGVNFGGVYGETVRDSWAAGLEGGVKYYVLPRTFVQAMVDYTWLFTDSDDFDDRFDDGLWNWSVSVGFNF